MSFLVGLPIFRGYVKFQGCRIWKWWVVWFFLMQMSFFLFQGSPNFSRFPCFLFAGCRAKMKKTAWTFRFWKKKSWRWKETWYFNWVIFSWTMRFVDPNQYLFDAFRTLDPKSSRKAKTGIYLQNMKISNKFHPNKPKKPVKFWWWFSLKHAFFSVPAFHHFRRWQLGFSSGWCTQTLGNQRGGWVMSDVWVIDPIGI